MSEQYVTQVGTEAGVPGLSWLAASANLIPNAGLPGGSSLLVFRGVDCWLAGYLQPRVSVSTQGLRISPVKERAAVPQSVSLGSQQVSGFLPHALCPSLSTEKAFSCLGARLHSGQPEELGSPGNKLKKCPHPSKAFPSHKNVLILSFCVPAQHSFSFLSKIKRFGTKDSLLISSGYFISLFQPYLDTHQDTLTGEPEAIGSHGN